MNASTLLSLEQGRHTASAILDCLEKTEERTRLVGLALLAELQFPFHGNGSDPVHPLLETVRVTGEAIGRYNAIRARFPDPGLDADQFVPAMEELRNTVFDIADYAALDQDSTLPAPRPRNGDRLFDIVRIKEWDNPRDWSATNLSWLARSGQWAYWSMNESSRVLLCRLAAASLTHRDLATAWLTLKVGRHLGFSLLLRGDARPVDMSIEDVLRDIGELPQFGDREPGWSGGMHRRFNMALFSLCNLGALNDIAWPAGYRFVGVNSDGPVPSDWMASHVRLRAPVISVPREDNSSYRTVYDLKI